LKTAHVISIVVQIVNYICSVITGKAVENMLWQAGFSLWQLTVAHCSLMV